MMNRTMDKVSSSRCSPMQPVMQEHGGNIYRASEETGIPVGRIMDFSASINPLGVPESVVRAIQEGIPYLPHYPEPFAGQLTMQLAEQLCIDPRTLICGNGGTELIYLVARAFGPRNVLIPAPTFSEYERACLTDRSRGRPCLPSRRLRSGCPVISWWMRLLSISRLSTQWSVKRRAIPILSF